MATIDLYENTTTCISTNIVSETSSNLDTCTVEVPFNYIISIGDELNIYDKTSTLIFKGLVQSIKIAGRKEVVAYDYGIQLMDININDIYLSQKAEDIIEDIVSTYTDLTYVSTIVTSSTITTFLIKDKKGWDVISELAELLNANFRVDKNKNFYLELIEEDISTETITTENAVIDDDWNQDADQLVNKITIIGDKQLFEKTQTFNGTGAQTTFTLAEFPVDTNVTVGGVEQTGYVEGATTTADYSVTTGTKDIIFTSGSIPGVGTGNVVVRYTFAIDIKLVSQDDVSITSYGGPNKITKEKKIVKPYITSFQEARNFANFYLGIYAQPLLTSTWIINNYTLFENFVPNQKINVVDSIRGINDTFIIKKVEREFPGQLKISIGWAENNILDWNKEVQYRIKQLEEIDNNSTILQEYGFIENNVQLQVTSTVERELERTLPDDSLFFFNAIDGLVGWWKGNGNALDYSGNGNIGTWAGTETYATGKQFDEAFDFDGASNVLVDYNLNGATSFSINLWVKFDTINSTLRRLISNQTNEKFYIRLNTSNVIDVFTGGLSDTYFSSLFTPVINTWYNIVLTYDGSTKYIYVNNDLKNSEAATGSLSVDSYLYIGANRLGSSEFLDGKIGDFRIYKNKVLTSNERTSLYNAGLGLTGNANIAEVGLGEDRVLSEEISGLVFWSKLDGNAIDYSGIGNNGTWSGTETYDVGKQFDLAANLDGSSSIAISDSTFDFGSSPFTITAYINPTSTANCSIIEKRVGTAEGYRLGITSNKFFLGLDTGGAETVVLSQIISTSIWYFVLVEYDGINMSISVNNIVKDSTAKTGSTDNNALLTIGTGGLGSFTGMIGDTRIYNKILSANERTRIYNSGLGIVDNAINEDGGVLQDIHYIFSDNNSYNLNPDSEIPNLESYYDLNGDSVDSVGGNNGTDTDITYVTGKVGQCASCNGSTSHIYADTSITGYPFTIMCWFKSNNISSSQGLLSIVDPLNAGIYYSVLIVSSKARIDARNGTAYTKAGTTTLSSGVWYHIAGVFESDTSRKLYVNGEIEAYDTISSIFNTSATVQAIGILRLASPFAYLNGLIDDTLIVSRAITTDEIKARYNEGSGKTDRYGSWETIT